VQPAFNIIARLSNPALPDQSTTVTVFGVKFEQWHYTVPADEFVMESVTFQALRIAFEET
jgi:hypothetical protein